MRQSGSETRHSPCKKYARESRRRRHGRSDMDFTQKMSGHHLRPASLRRIRPLQQGSLRHIYRVYGPSGEFRAGRVLAGRDGFSAAVRVRRKGACGQNTRNGEGAYGADDFRRGFFHESARKTRQRPQKTRRHRRARPRTLYGENRLSPALRPDYDRRLDGKETRNAGHTHHTRAGSRRPRDAARPFRHNRGQNI